MKQIIEVEAGNKIIGEFDGKKVTDSIMDAAFGDKDLHHTWDLKYHTSWDWQVPVWSKAAKEVKGWLVKKDESMIRNYFRLSNQHEDAVFNNDTLEGHRVLVELLTWYNKHKQP